MSVEENREMTAGDLYRRLLSIKPDTVVCAHNCQGMLVRLQLSDLVYVEKQNVVVIGKDD